MSALVAYADVILPLAIDGLTYAVPDTMTIEPGMLVGVPVGKRKIYTGIVLKVHDNRPAFDCKDILTVLTPKPVVTQQQLWLWQWIADYYMSPLGDVFNAAMPAPVRKHLTRTAPPRTSNPLTESLIRLPEQVTESLIRLPGQELSTPPRSPAVLCPPYNRQRTMPLSQPFAPRI